MIISPISLLTSNHLLSYHQSPDHYHLLAPFLKITPNHHHSSHYYHLLHFIVHILSPMYISPHLPNCLNYLLTYLHIQFKLIQAQLSAHTDWIRCMYLAQNPRLPFCGLIYVHLIHLWCRYMLILLASWSGISHTNRIQPESRVSNFLLFLANAYSSQW